MLNIDGTLLSGNRPIAEIRGGILTEANDALLPLYLKRTRNLESWLASRAIDSHRTHSRLLKKALRLRTADDAQTALAVNAATVTDTYWFRPAGSNAAWADIRFRTNDFDQLALRGDPDAFALPPSRTPELTNIGSFEKCWRRIDGAWWMYKSGTDAEYFSELFICKLGQALGLDMAHYEMDGAFIRSKDFTNNASVNFEPMRALTDDDDDYCTCFRALTALSPVLAQPYLLLIWMDTICYNMDRHTENFGILRDPESGQVLSLAPNFDNNIALIAKGFPKDVSRVHDGLISFFGAFLQRCADARAMYRQMYLPVITAAMIDRCMDEIPISVDRTYIRDFILNGQSRVQALIDAPTLPESR